MFHDGLAIQIEKEVFLNFSNILLYFGPFIHITPLAMLSNETP